MRKGIILGVILLAGLHFRTSALNNEKKTIEAQKVTESQELMVFWMMLCGKMLYLPVILFSTNLIMEKCHQNPPMCV